MPNLNFQVTGVDPAVRGMTPLLHFKLRLEVVPETTRIEALLLNCQIQFQCSRRSYSASEQEKLVELFGTPERWGQTLRNRLWTHANTTVASFSGTTETLLPVACSYDLNIAATKYFYALEAGDVSLLFLFSGSVFYLNSEERLQVERVPWNKEAEFRLPVQAWQTMMESHYPNSAWLSLRRDVFDRLYQYKRRHGLATWEQALESLLTVPSEESFAALPAPFISNSGF